MPQREFANQKALVAYAEQNSLAYEYEYTPAFAKWQRQREENAHALIDVVVDTPECRPMRPIGEGYRRMTGCSKSTALLSSCNACRGLMFAAALA
jgi:hypothetical protein